MVRLKRQRLNENGDEQVTSAAGAEQDGGIKGQKAKESGSSLIVKSLPATVHNEDLIGHFSQSFPIKHATVVYDKHTRTSKGFGFVTFAESDDASAAKQEFDNTELHGGRISLDFARPRHREEGAHTESSKLPAAQLTSASTSQSPRKIIIRNLPWSIKRKPHLASLFEGFGELQYINMPKPANGRSPGFGFVVFKRHKDAKRALEGMNEKHVAGRQLALDWAVDKSVWHDLHDRAAEAEAEAEANMADVMHTTPADDEENLTPRDVAEDPECKAQLENLRDVNSCTPTGVKSNTSEGSEEHFATTIFVRNVPFTATDDSLGSVFKSFGPLKFARIVKDPVIGNSKGTAFVRFQFKPDADACLRDAALCASCLPGRPLEKDSVLQDQRADPTGRFTMDDRVLLVSQAVGKVEAAKIASSNARSHVLNEGDRRRLFLLAEGNILPENPLHSELSAAEAALREDSTKQRRSLVSKDPSLCLSLTRLSVRNLPRSLTSKDLGALARKAAVGFATDVKNGLRRPLSKEERNRDSRNMKLAEDSRRAKGRGIVKQGKIIFENREGSKVDEGSQSGRSRGYGFIEYSSHRWALMGLRWLNGRLVGPETSSSKTATQKRRLIVEFAIENSQVVARREQREGRARGSPLAKGRKLEGQAEGVHGASSPSSRSDFNNSAANRTEIKPTQSSTPDGTVPGLDAQMAKDKLRVIGRKRMAKRRRTR